MFFKFRNSLLTTGRRHNGPSAAVLLTGDLCGPLVLSSPIYSAKAKIFLSPPRKNEMTQSGWQIFMSSSLSFAAPPPRAPCRPPRDHNHCRPPPRAPRRCPRALLPLLPEHPAVLPEHRRRSSASATNADLLLERRRPSSLSGMTSTPLLASPTTADGSPCRRHHLLFCMRGVSYSRPFGTHRGWGRGRRRRVDAPPGASICFYFVFQNAITYNRIWFMDYG